MGDQTTMTMTNEYAELSLEGIDMSARLDTDRLMVQCNKEGGNPFNFTAIVLVKKDVNTGIQTMSDVRGQMSEGWYTLDGRRIANGQQPTAKGLYIVNGKKIIRY